jgi:hypothetical protein
MPIDAASWYDRGPDEASLYQGDVISNVPIVLMPPAGGGPWTILRPSPPQTVEQVLAGQTPRVLKPHAESARPDAWQDGQDLVLAKGIRKSVMIVTQSCDLTSRNWIQVAPVFPASAIQNVEKRASLTINEIGYMFFLPGDPPHVENSFADLSMLTSVHRSYLRGAQRTLHLTSTARALFQKHLANLHGRPFSFNLRDDVPESGEYLCHHCFLARGVISRSQHEQGQRFRECGSCGEDALWILLAGVHLSE